MQYTTRVCNKIQQVCNNILILLTRLILTCISYRNIIYHINFCFSSISLIYCRAYAVLLAIVRDLTNRLYISDISVNFDYFYVAICDPNRHACFVILFMY